MIAQENAVQLLEYEMFVEYQIMELEPEAGRFISAVWLGARCLLHAGCRALKRGCSGKREQLNAFVVPWLPLSCSGGKHHQCKGAEVAALCFTPVSVALWAQGSDKVDHGLVLNPSGWLAELHQADKTNFTFRRVWSC